MKRSYKDFRRLLWIGSVGLLSMGGCRKSNSFPGESGKTVYVAGSNGTHPILWRNGLPQILSSSTGDATQVIASGADIYVAGVVKVNASFLAFPNGEYAYWKNGKEVAFGGDMNIVDGLASMALVGNQLYFCAGSVWANGSPITLPDQGYYVWSVFSTGADLYAVGIDRAGNSVYWKNGQIHPIAAADSATSIGNLGSIYVSGADVYVLGQDSLGFASYWKNGVLNELHSTHANAYISNIRSICVNGNDVYIAGSYFTTGLPMPAYWKNGVEQDLPVGNQSTGEAAGICVVDSDVFVAGSTSGGAVYWKNGVESILSSVGYANSILVH